DPARCVRIRLRSRHERHRRPPHTPPEEARWLPDHDRDSSRRRDPARGDVVNTPATLGRGLGRSIAVATIIGMLVFGVVVAIVISIADLGEECMPGVLVDDPPIVIIKECAVALAFAAPLGIALSLLIGRKLTQGTTERLDEVIETASRMTGERLDE